MITPPSRLRFPAAALVLAGLWGPGCATVPIVPDGMTALAAMQAADQRGEPERVVLIHKKLEAQDGVSFDELAEGAFLAAGAHIELGNHLEAFTQYRRILETWPWSEFSASIEPKLYELGQVFLFDERYDGWIFHQRARGVSVLETLVAHFQRSELADDALMLVAEHFADPKTNEPYEAVLTYERLYKDYPESEWAEKALWLAGHMRLEISHGAHYDRDDLLRSEILLRRSLAEHPRGMYQAEVRADLARVREVLARCELDVADFYAARGEDAGQQLRLANAAILYPDTQAGTEARQRLEALGLDPKVLAADSRLNAVDNVAPGVDRFGERGSVFGFGF